MDSTLFKALPACVALIALLFLGACAPAPALTGDGPFAIVLGTAQDGGIPQAGSFGHPGWTDDRHRRLVACLAVVDPDTDRAWMFDATPDFREQLFLLHRARGGSAKALPDGIFLTHAHMGHYTGLMFLGYESMGAGGVPVYAMARMGEFLLGNGPWDQLIGYRNIELRPLSSGEPVALTRSLTVTPFLVPHRQEYSEVVGLRIDGSERSVLYLPDIDSWEEWDEAGVHIEDLIADVDVAYLDGTFFANGEIPGRDMTGFPHPFITHSLERFGHLPPEERAKIRFIHLNHTNPAQFDGPERRRIEAAGMGVAARGERFELSNEAGAH